MTNEEDAQKLVKQIKKDIPKANAEVIQAGKKWYVKADLPHRWLTSKIHSRTEWNSLKLAWKHI